MRRVVLAGEWEDAIAGCMERRVRREGRAHLERFRLLDRHCYWPDCLETVGRPERVWVTGDRLQDQTRVGQIEKNITQTQRHDLLEQPCVASAAAQNPFVEEVAYAAQLAVTLHTSVVLVCETYCMQFHESVARHETRGILWIARHR